MGFAERIRAARAFDRSRYKDFRVDGCAIGHVREDLAAHLRQFNDVFVIADGAVTFAPRLVERDARTAAMAHVAQALAAQGMLTAWRDELYEIGTAADGAGLFKLERAAVRYFGFLAHAVHINGLTVRDGKVAMWIARRADSKAIDPGMLDNLVGGGLAAGLSVAETVIKESWEEAGIPRDLAALARAEGCIDIVREVREGLHAEVIELHDLMLPAAFMPCNQDGEVAELRVLPLHEVVALIEGDASFTVDAALVAMDCLARHGAIDAQWSGAIRARIFQ